MMLTAAYVQSRLGDPRNETSVALWDVPPALEIGVIPRKIYCSRAMVEPLTRAFSNLIDTGLVRELITWDGCFNVRNSKAGGLTWSMHAWGLAVDVNAAWNGYNKKPTMSKPFVQCFTDAGFDWGGVWTKPDGMHFQLSKLP